MFYSIIKKDEHWFLDCDGKLIALPYNDPMFNSIWEGVSKMLDVYADDCGANLDRCVQFCEDASRLFAGVSQLAADMAVDYKKQIELNELYAHDENERWDQRWKSITSLLEFALLPIDISAEL